MADTKPKPPPEFNAEFVRDVSVKAYLDRLGTDGPKMLADDGEAKVRARAVSHDSLTKSYLRGLVAIFPELAALFKASPDPTAEPEPEPPPPAKKRGRKPK